MQAKNFDRLARLMRVNGSSAKLVEGVADLFNDDPTFDRGTFVRACGLEPCGNCGHVLAWDTVNAEHYHPEGGCHIARALVIPA